MEKEKERKKKKRKKYRLLKSIEQVLLCNIILVFVEPLTIMQNVMQSMTYMNS